MHSNSNSREPSPASALRSLHSQISTTVIDYSPWMRQKRRTPSSSAATKTKIVSFGLPRKIDH